MIITDQPNFNEPFNGTLLTPIMSPLGIIISFFKFVTYDLLIYEKFDGYFTVISSSRLLARVMSLDLMALLLDPSLLKVIFYDLILCTVLLLWYVNIMSSTPVTNEKL